MDRVQACKQARIVVAGFGASLRHELPRPLIEAAYPKPERPFCKTCNAPGPPHHGGAGFGCRAGLFPYQPKPQFPYADVFLKRASVTHDARFKFDLIGILATLLAVMLGALLAMLGAPGSGLIQNRVD